MVDIAGFNREMIAHLIRRMDYLERKMASHENSFRKLRKELEDCKVHFKVVKIGEN